MDNHEDEYNHSFADLSLKGKLVYRFCQMNTRLYRKYVVKAYGVTKGRCDFIREVYGFPDSKIELLLMGVDDEKVHYDRQLDGCLIKAEAGTPSLGIGIKIPESLLPQSKTPQKACSSIFADIIIYLHFDCKS